MTSQPYNDKPISRDIAGFRLSFKSFRPQGSLPKHRSPLGTVCVVLGGAISETDERGAYAFETADTVYRPPREVHANSLGCAGARVVLVEACEARLSKFERDGLPVEAFTAHRSPSAAAMASSIANELRSREPSPLILEGLALQLWGEVLRPHSISPQSTPDWLLRVRTFIAAEPSRRARGHDLAALAGVSMSHLTRSARKFFGCSLSELRLRLQIEQAVQIINSDAGRPMAEVALMCGFFDQSHLTRAFRKFTGLTPSAYRRNLPR